MPKSDDLYLRHINDEVAFLRSLPEFSSGSFLKEDPVHSRAVVRSLEIIGEAASKISSDFRAQHAEIPWRRVIALRNRLIHEYMGINFNIVLNVLNVEIPRLAIQLEVLLNEDSSADNEND